MEIIYRYHGFPEKLRNLLVNLDKDQQERILTGLGATEHFDKLCGLGQGSSLAPLKWNLFLDPLLKWQNQEEDKYIFGDIKLGAMAFADDTGWISTCQEGYLKKMQNGNVYLNFFGAEYNGVKTKLLYIDPKRTSPPTPAIVTSVKTNTSTECSVTTPTEQHRILGAKLSTSMSHSQTVKEHQAHISRTLRLVDKKRLNPDEARMIISLVIEWKIDIITTIYP